MVATSSASGHRCIKARFDSACDCGRNNKRQLSRHLQGAALYPFPEYFEVIPSTKQNNSFNMPLVVPGVTADNLGDDQIQEWANKLVGKTISDTPSSETVSETILRASLSTTWN
jgi:hypothetical protein